MSTERFEDSSLDFSERFNSLIAQELMRLHFAQQVASGITRTYGSLLFEAIEDDYKTPQEAKRLADEVMRAEFPLLVVSDADSETGAILDLSLIKVDPTTGKKLNDSWISVVGLVEEDGTLTTVYSPWTNEQATLIQQQANEQILVDLDPRKLYYDAGHGWTK